MWRPEEEDESKGAVEIGDTVNPHKNKTKTIRVTTP